MEKDSGKFVRGKLSLKEESKDKKELKVKDVDVAQSGGVQAYTPTYLKKAGEGSYEFTKQKYGVRAATDDDSKARTRKDSRFALSELLRDPLSVEQEERRVIEEKVRSRISAIEAEVRDKAVKKGYDEGLQMGYAEAYKKFAKEAEDRVRQLDEFLRACETAKEKILKENERFMIELIFRIARSIVLKEVNADRQYVVRLAQELVERVGIRDNIRIKIHPRDAANIDMIKEALGREIGELKNLHIEASEAIRGGGCVVETQWNAIDASIDTQLAGIEEALIGSKKSTSDAA